ncbi:hypothetical protein FHT44_000176 [Mycolicibacterium sp. BK634]|uniref:hypothetical protein n=1 Tax=Mycolicibacterium sp. BK634 TaxID=2587099 RepID=UPI001619E242|nr:hypothetical protein [Mycolicibacterium sp. BK634]MBB3747715.1 hypothetical protein [Mycolicibacterium sp. BK634]
MTTREFTVVVLVSLPATEEVSATATRFERDVTRDDASVRFALRGVVDRVSTRARGLAVPVPPLDEETDEDDPTPLSAPATPIWGPTRNQPTSAAPMPADATPS